MITKWDRASALYAGGPVLVPGTSWFRSNMEAILEAKDGSSHGAPLDQVSKTTLQNKVIIIDTNNWETTMCQALNRFLATDFKLKWNSLLIKTDPLVTCFY